MTEPEAGVVALARQAIAAAVRDDHATAATHLARARAASRTRARRERQFVELVTAVVEGPADRAAGLITEHCSEFPYDAGLLDELMRARSRPEGPW
jgi:hypothetical protein